jgi:two-component system, OmpR family, heavy metal sensor histidine kinase CusS
MGGKAWSGSSGSWSISKRLVGLFTLAAFVVLAVSCLFLDFALKSDMEQEDRQFVTAKMQSLRILLREYPGNVVAWKSEIERETFSAASAFLQYYVRILGEDGAAIVETTGMDQVAAPQMFLQPAANGGGASFVHSRAKDGKPFLLMQAIAGPHGAGGSRHVVQIALDMSHEGAIIKDYRQKVVVVFFGGVFVSALLGFFIARSGLRPLKALTRKVESVTPENLQPRVGSTGWPEEVATLAGTFDTMLDHLEAAFTSLSQYSANLAHELRTPINNLRGEAEVALYKARTVEEYRDVLQSSLEEYERLSRMIDNLLFLARADSRKGEIQKTLFDARGEVKEVLEYYDPLREEKQMNVGLSGDARLYADRALFRRALGNVLSNAFQYTPDHGNIAISIGEGEYVEIIVRDSGIGIEPESLSRIFDRFYRTPRARSIHPQGMGLGFSIVKSIMELHGGAVEVASEPLRGTSVVMRFSKASRQTPQHS